MGNCPTGLSLITLMHACDRQTLTRVVLADDHAAVRAAIADLLADIAGVELVGAACDGREAIKLTAELKPDILFLDLAMPLMSGMDALPLINEAQPGVHIVILSMHGSEEHVLRALNLGAVGFMLKESAPEEMARAIESVNRGINWLSPTISKKVIADYLERSGGDKCLNVLTARQTQVLKLIAEGCNTQQLSSSLKLSASTIETYRRQLMDKLDIRDNAGLLDYAVRRGIVPL